MKKYLSLTDETWQYGSYHRKQYKTDTIYITFCYKEFAATYVRGLFYVEDRLVDAMRNAGFISEEKWQDYQNRATAFANRIMEMDELPIESIYRAIQKLRQEVFGLSVLERYKVAEMEKSVRTEWNPVLCQKKKKEELFQTSQTVIMALCEPEWFSDMREDITTLLEKGKKVYLLYSKEGGSLPTKDSLEQVLGMGSEKVGYLEMEDEDRGLCLSKVAWKEIDLAKTMLCVYGEEGLLHCKALHVPSMVHAMPRGFFARLLTNQMDVDRTCMVYVPPHWNMLQSVPSTTKTLCNYYHVAKLWRNYGDCVYQMSVEDYYRKWPEVFVNIYENAGEAVCPICFQMEEEEAEDIYASFYKKREESIAAYFEKLDQVTYLSAYFEDGVKQKEIPWGKANQKGILVHGIKLQNAKEAKVLDCSGKGTLRQWTRNEKKEGIRLFSNFLFFFTPKLAYYYNALRKERPKEQIHLHDGHVDYKLEKQNGKRVETFPLYQKSCIAMKKDGSFLFFDHMLGGGRLTIEDYEITWKKEDVNADPFEKEIVIYTPYRSKEEENVRDYVLPVGKGRINLVIIQNQVVCVREGDVLLPSIGVVVSLSDKQGKTFLETTMLDKLEDGYYDCSKLYMELELEPPSTIDATEWEQVNWVYGGGLALFSNGKNLFEDSGMDALAKAGWMSPLSKQTQESEIHTLVKHPRTGIGITEKGELFVLVYSGRTNISTGADYQEMCQIAKELIPNVSYMMNVDGGGSSMLGMEVDGTFMELSYPASSTTSVAGQVRPIHTVLCIEPYLR